MGRAEEDELKQEEEAKTVCIAAEFRFGVHRLPFALFCKVIIYI
jgi:hypothetical protein